MVLPIQLTPEQEQRLREAARLQGVETVELARRMLLDKLEESSNRTGTDAAETPGDVLASELFASWDQQDQAATPAEQQVARQMHQQFQRELDAERQREGSPRRLFPWLT